MIMTLQKWVGKNSLHNNGIIHFQINVLLHLMYHRAYRPCSALTDVNCHLKGEMGRLGWLIYHMKSVFLDLYRNTWFLGVILMSFACVTSLVDLALMFYERHIQCHMYSLPFVLEAKYNSFANCHYPLRSLKTCAQTSVQCQAHNRALCMWQMNLR